MKNLVASMLFFIGLIANVVNAEEVSIPEFAAVFQLETSDAASVAGALTKFAQSDCRKNMPTSIRIMAESFNGDEDISHSVIWSFPDADAVQTSFAAFASCREWADAWAVLSQQADYKSNQLFKTLLAGGDYTQDGAYTIWQMSISDEAAYVAAYEKLMASQIKEGILNGGYGLWRVQGGANSNFTHMAFAGAKDMATLLSNTNPSRAFLDFQKKVAGIRKIHRQNIVTVVTDL
jgi:hypothetical protein